MEDDDPLYGEHEEALEVWLEYHSSIDNTEAQRIAEEYDDWHTTCIPEPS